MANKYDVYNLNPLIIGGRNLLLDTGRSFTGIGVNSINATFNAQGGQYYLAGGKKVSDIYNQYGPSGYLTLSFDWVASGDIISGQFNPQLDNEPWFSYNPVILSSTNTSDHYKTTFSLNPDAYSTAIATGIRFRQDNLQGNITISNMKLEAGNVATDWSPAPEDLQPLTTIEGDLDSQNYTPITATGLTPNTKYNLGVVHAGDSIFDVTRLPEFTTTKYI